MILENKEFPYKFDASKCSECMGNCCIGESGYIWITYSEICTLAKFLNISEQELFKKYIFKQGYKFSIKEKKLDSKNFSCVFFDLDKKQCSIYNVRPTQCRTFPFWDYFKTRVNEVKEECPAIID